MFIYKHCNCKECKTTQDFPDNRVKSIVDLLRMVSVPSRLNILLLLKQSPHCVCDIETHTKMSQTLISHHLSDLAKAGLIESKKEGKFIEYRLNAKGNKVVSHLAKLFKEFK